MREKFEEEVAPDYSLKVYVAPLLKTNWGQWEPYNWACPVFSYPIGDYKAAAGCEAIAVAQVAAYYQYPSTCKGHVYDWESILQDSIVYLSNTDGAITQNHPMIVFGCPEGSNDGHCWVIDGIAVKIMRMLCVKSEDLPYTPEIVLKRQYVHCNWGMSGSYNGWFNLSSYMTMWNIENDKEIENDYYTKIALG